MIETVAPVSFAAGGEGCAAQRRAYYYNRKFFQFYLLLIKNISAGSALIILYFCIRCLVHRNGYDKSVDIVARNCVGIV